MIGLLLKNPYVILIAVLSFAGAFRGYSLWLYNKGYNKATTMCDIAKSEVINDNIKIKQNQDIIPRPDTIDYIKRLREGKV